MSQIELAEMAESIAEQTKDLCQVHNHITRVIANLEIEGHWFEGYTQSRRAKYALEPVALMLLYRYTRDFTQQELADRLKGAAYLYVRFGLKHPPTQQSISYNERNRFTRQERQALKQVASRIQGIARRNDVIEIQEPPLRPADLQGRDIADEQINEAVEKATELGFSEFTANRASNSKYDLSAYFERQAYLNMSDAGTTTERRRFARLSNRDEVPHGSSHNRTMKKVADPDRQTTLADFADGGHIPDWKRIRDTVLPAFHAGVELQLDEIAGRDREGIQQPVIAAIDITTFNFWPSPFKSEDDVDWSEKPVTANGREVYPKEDYPEMVSGFKSANKEKPERGYKFATITIVAQDTPLVLGIEPVRDYRWWERQNKDEVETTSREGIVERLLDQAEQHVDIHKLFCDREFDVHGIRDVADQRDITYVIGKTRQSTADYENIKEIEADPVYDHRVEHAELTVDGRTHKVSLIYLPGTEYSIFTVNGWVDPDRAQALTSQYRQRWVIENEYKTIKQHFLPQTATKDYRTRFLYFVIGVVMYNVWRLTNFLLRDEVTVDLGESPPLPAGELTELVALCLFDPGG
jgi:hypothetical protein